MRDKHYRAAGKELNYFDKEIRVQGKNKFWADYAEQVVAGDSTGDHGSDLLVLWSDGELTLYPSVDEKGFHGEKQVLPPSDTSKHAAAMTAGRYGGNQWQDDLVVRWTDGELTGYQNTGTSLGKEIKVVDLKPDGLWKHAMLPTGGDFSDNPWPDDTIVRWTDGELSLYTEGNASGIGTEHQLVAP